jgi:hypothetical protein
MNKKIQTKKHNSLKLLCTILDIYEPLLMNLKAESFLEKVQNINAYFQYLYDCVIQSNATDLVLTEQKKQMHHIFAPHVFKSLQKEGFVGYERFEHMLFNLVPLTYKQHVEAHRLLYEIYGFNADRTAHLLMSNQTENGWISSRIDGAYACHKKQRENLTGFADHSLQKHKALLSLEKDRLNLYDARSRGGKTSGQMRWKNHLIQPEDRFLVFYEKKPVFCILNCATGGQIIDVFHHYQKTPIQRVTRLLKNSKNSLNGWSLQKIQ